MIDELRAALEAERVLESPLARHLYSKDAGVFRGDATVVVVPVTTEEVQEVVRIARRHGVSIVARGAGTGLAAGAVPIGGGIVLSTTRMNQIHEIDPVNRTAWVGPGVINLDLSRATAGLGLHFAPDPSSQAACTIGGNVANNSGGPHCLAEGSTVNHVLALEVVLADGSVTVVGSSAPDEIGLDLRGMLVGSEGTLAIVTRALVKLTTNSPDVRTLLAWFDSVADAAATVSGVIAAGVVPAALEMMDQAMTQAVENWLHAGLPTEAAAILLAEVVGETAAVEAEAELIRRIAIENHARGAGCRRRGRAGPALERTQGGLRGRCPGRTQLLPPRHRGAAHQARRDHGGGLSHRRQAWSDNAQRLPCRRRQPSPADGIRRRRARDAREGPGRGRRAGRTLRAAWEAPSRVSTGSVARSAT